jgi:hypothetical protein
LGFSGRPWCWCSCRGTSVWLNSEPASRCGRGPASPRGRIRGPPGLRLAAAARGGSLPARSCACLSSRRTRVSSAATLGMKLWTQMTSCSWPAQTEARRGSQRMRNGPRAVLGLLGGSVASRRAPMSWQGVGCLRITHGRSVGEREPKVHSLTKGVLRVVSRARAKSMAKSPLSLTKGETTRRIVDAEAEHAPQDRHTV